MREAINRKQQLSITKILERLQKSISYSFQNNINGFLDINEVEDAFNDSGLEDNKLELLLKSYCSNIYLPNNSESDPCFEDSYISGLENCIKTHVLRLSYDRKSYGISLTNALSRVIVTCDSQHPLAVSICK